jgi:hypothetical protein
MRNQNGDNDGRFDCDVDGDRCRRAGHGDPLGHQDAVQLEETMTISPWQPNGKTPDVILMHGVDHTLTAYGEGWSQRVVMPFAQLHDVPVPIVDITAVPPRRLISILEQFGAMNPPVCLDVDGLMAALVIAGGYVSLPAPQEVRNERTI